MSREIEGGQILFKLGKWEIHSMIEYPEWAEIFHHCKPWGPKDDRLTYSYALPGDTECPMCHATQPDEIQALTAMHNMDKPPQIWRITIMDQIEQHYALLYEQIKHELDDISLTGDGVSERTRRS